MVTKRLKVAGAYALGALFAILMIAVSVMAQTIIDMKGGRIADGIELPFGAETMYAMADTQSVTAPVIDTLGIEGITDNVKAGGRFRVAVVLKDYNKSIKGAGIVLKNPDTGSMISAGGDNTALTDGKYIDVVAPEYAQGGVYVVDRVVLMDSDMKTHIYYNPDIYNSDYISDTKTALTDNQKKLSVTVVSDKKDNSAPKLYSYEIEKNSASAGEEIMFAVEAEDVLEVVKDVYNNDVVYSGSGLESLKVNWERQQNESEKTSLLGRYSFVIETAFADLKQNNNVYYGTFRIPSSYAAGKYMIKNIEKESDEKKKEKILELKVLIVNDEKWINLPCDGKLYNEYKILDFKTELLIDDFMIFDSNINQLNDFALMVKKISDKDFEKLNVILSSGVYAESLGDVMDVIQNLELFEVINNISNYYELGEYFGRDKENIEYEKLGKTIAEDENGIFLDNVYLSCSNPSYYQGFWGQI